MFLTKIAEFAKFYRSRGRRRGFRQLPFEGGGSFWPGQNGEAPTGADPLAAAAMYDDFFLLPM